MEHLYRPAIANSYGRRLKKYVQAVAADPSLLDAVVTLVPDYSIMNETAEVFMKAMLLGMEPDAGQHFADAEPVEILPYEEALEYMSKRLPVDKKTYYTLDDKMRYRAFTVSRLADGDAVKQVHNVLTGALEKGTGMRPFLQMTEGELADAAGMGRGAGWYYETVYRTNTSTAYNVGRAIGYEAVPPVALELIGIDDERQTEVCHALTVPPFRRPYGDPVWEHLWPPFHFNCRTTVRAIYDETEIDEAGGTDNYYSAGTPDYRPAKGFGTYPVDKTDTWWDLTDAMRERAGEYNLVREFFEAKEMLIVKNDSGITSDEAKVAETLHGQDYVENVMQRVLAPNERPEGVHDGVLFMEALAMAVRDNPPLLEALRNKWPEAVERYMTEARKIAAAVKRP